MSSLSLYLSKVVVCRFLFPVFWGGSPSPSLSLWGGGGSPSHFLSGLLVAAVPLSLSGVVAVACVLSVCLSAGLSLYLSGGVVCGSLSPLLRGGDRGPLSEAVFSLSLSIFLDGGRSLSLSLSLGWWWQSFSFSLWVGGGGGPSLSLSGVVVSLACGVVLWCSALWWGAVVLRCCGATVLRCCAVALSNDRGRAREKKADFPLRKEGRHKEGERGKQPSDSHSDLAPEHQKKKGGE